MISETGNIYSFEIDTVVLPRRFQVTSYSSPFTMQVANGWRAISKALGVTTKSMYMYVCVYLKVWAARILALNRLTCSAKSFNVRQNLSMLSKIVQCSAQSFYVLRNLVMFCKVFEHSAKCLNVLHKISMFSKIFQCSAKSLHHSLRSVHRLIFAFAQIERPYSATEKEITKA